MDWVVIIIIVFFLVDFLCLRLDWVLLDFILKSKNVFCVSGYLYNFFVVKLGIWYCLLIRLIIWVFKVFVKVCFLFLRLYIYILFLICFWFLGWFCIWFWLLNLCFVVLVDFSNMFFFFGWMCIRINVIDLFK